MHPTKSMQSQQELSGQSKEIISNNGKDSKTFQYLCFSVIF